MEQRIDEVREITKGRQSNETQESQILYYMRHNGVITPLDALRLFGCMRLASRVADLRKKGYTIITTPITVQKANGKWTQVAGYSLVEAV